MKDPLIKEKAKLYDEATERAKKVLLDCTPEERKVVEYIHPGLAEDKEEDKDERIRKEIISFLKEGNPHYCPNSVRRQEWFTWLKKQGEQKPTDTPKFRVGDWVVNNNGEPRVFRVEKQDWPDSIISGSLGNQFINTDTLNKQYHLWTIQDARDGDVLVASDSSTFIFKEVVELGCKYYIALAKDNEVINVNDNLEHCWETSSSVYPATKEQRDLLFQKMKEAGYEWDAEKKELKKD